MSGRIVAGAAVALACALALALGRPGAAIAGCGGTVTSAPRHHPAGRLPPLALGDSTMLLSLPGLAAAGYDGNAHGCRQLVQTLPMLAQLRAQRRLPHMVTIALGSNCCATAQQIGQLLSILGPTRLLVLVTPVHAPSTDALERSEARAHPGRILLLDWERTSAGHGSWFQPDGLHLTMPGVYAFTALLARALPYAYEPCPPAPGRARSSRRRARRAQRQRVQRVQRTQRRRAQRAQRRRAQQQRRAQRRRARTAADPPAASEPASPALSLTLTDARPGWVAAQLTGPPGATVSLGERRAGAVKPLQTVTMPASGTIDVPRLLSWLCSPRSRTVVASSTGAAGATDTIKTPSCSGRLRVRASARGRVGRTLAVRVSDRWRVGDAPLRVCVTGPGGLPACRRGSLAPGRASERIRVALTRPGRWTVAIGTGYGRAAVRRVWASHPGGRLRLLAAGDSEMQILDDMLGQDLDPHGVRVTSDARISTGLTNSFFFDWQREARRQAAATRPDVSLVYMGANDGYAVAGPDGKPVQCCGRAWSEGYANLAARMMATLLRGQAGRVYWFLLPAPRPANFHSLFDAVNAGIRLAARRFPGRVSLIDANAFFTPGDRYRNQMTYKSHSFTIHESDGIHISAAADAVAAQLVLARLRSDHVIR